MKILLVGGGGREHALAWALTRRPGIELHAAPGNPGVGAHARLHDIAATDIGKLVEWARRERPDLVVVGPEAPLVAGLADALTEIGAAVFGCSRRAAELEGSKAFAKAFLARHAIPTAAFGTFDEVAAAERFVDEQFAGGAGRLVVKADGLAAGKGVEICDSAAEARAAVQRLLGERTLGAAGARLVIEEFLVGREASLMALVDGERVVPLDAAEDHKTVFDGDRGPMTGGMGAVSPTPVLDAAATRRAVAEVLEPTARGLLAEGRPYRGLLYAGLMMTAAGPKVLEYNCRFGDPETQPLVCRLEDDLAELLHGAASGRLPPRLRFSPDAALCVVMTSAGYPVSTGGAAPAAISGLDRAGRVEGVIVFQAGTRLAGGALVTAGGRVLGVTARGASIAVARARAYEAAAHIEFSGAHYRRDIGARSP